MELRRAGEVGAVRAEIMRTRVLLRSWSVVIGHVGDEYPEAVAVAVGEVSWALGAVLGVGLP